MIDAEDIERAEKVLRIIYDSPDRQLELLQVDREIFDKFLAQKIDLLKQRYGNLWHEMDPRLEPAINTLLVHFFLTGVIIGRGEQRRIE